MRYFKLASRWVLAALFIGAGILHLLRPIPFIEITPPSIPRPDLAVLISGGAEILGGIGILVARVRPAARWGLIALLATVFPANVYMAQNHIQPGSNHIPEWILWARLPLQPLLMWWVFASTTDNKKAASNSRPRDQY